MHASGVHEDDIVAYYEYCRFGHGGAVPSIDTPLHAFITQDHVDHLHPDSMIALAAAEGSEALVAECYGAEVGWLPWKRPGFELGLALRDFQRRSPDARGAVLEGHGMICWADTSEECEALSLDLIARAEQFLADRDLDGAFGAVREATPRSPTPNGAAGPPPWPRSCAGWPRRSARWSARSATRRVVLDFLSREAAPRLAAQGTSCPDHFLRTKVRPLFLDLPATATLDEQRARLDELHEQYRADYRAYYDAYADEGSPAMRGADPVIVLVPGVGMWSFGADPQTARVAGEFYINAINVMRGAEAMSTYAPIDDHEKFRIEYWELEERKLRMRPAAPALQGRVALVTGAASGIGRAIAELLSSHGACVVVADLDGEGAEKVAAALGTERALGIAADVSSEEQVGSDVRRRRRAASAASTSSSTTPGSPPPRRSSTPPSRTGTGCTPCSPAASFLVSRGAARQMIEQDIGGDIVYIVSKNAVVAGPQNVAYGAAKADQAHQIRLLAAELGVHDIRVNGVNPDGVVQGSGIFQGEWLRQRAEAYGVAPEDLGKYYAGRTLLGREIVPEHVAEAVFVLVGGSLSRTTGLTIPVDGGVAAAFLR